MYLNEKRGFFRIVMHHCPSKGRLLEQKEKTGLEPYPHYCLHCDYYRAAVEKHGLKYLYDFTGVDKASCSLMVYDPKVFDGRIIIDEDTEVMVRSASQNEYFHRDFHHSMNRCLHFVGEKFGEEGLRELLEGYTDAVWGSTAERVKKEGLLPLREAILSSYEKEKAPDAIEATLDGDVLLIQIHYCPAVKYLRETGKDVSCHFGKSTEYVMARLAALSGLGFEMIHYNEESGAAAFRFTK